MKHVISQAGRWQHILRSQRTLYAVPRTVVLGHRTGHVLGGSSRCPSHRRHVSTEAITGILMPPAVFSGLLVALWTYKCMMMVLFQNKIIYMPSVPPFARSEKVEDYAAQSRPVVWREHNLESVDRTALKILEGAIPDDDTEKRPTKVVILYFQGNASSLPPRLPYLSQILKAVQANQMAQVSLVALSYRGFWKSKGRPSQAGLEKDAEAAIQWVLKRYDETCKVVIWGQSIGTGVATLGAAALCRRDRKQFERISGLLLETPFVNMRALLKAMYPQKWLPYRYLTPFLLSTWEIKAALEDIGDAASQIRVMLLQAGDDEIVPDGQASILEEACRAEGITVNRQIITGALHQDVMMKPAGRKRIVEFIGSFVPEQIVSR